MDPRQLVVASLVGGGLVAAFVVISYSYRPRHLRSYPAAIGWTLVGAVAGAGVSALSRRFGWVFPGADWVIVALLGAGVAVGELVSRYRDEPMRALVTVPALLYMSINGLAAVATLAISQAFGWVVESPGEAGGTVVHWPQVLAAGLGAMTLLRSSVFKVRAGDKDVAVGPSTFLDAIVDAADRAVDRVRAQDRAWAVARAMVDVDEAAYSRAFTVLPDYLLALSQNIRDEDITKFRERVDKLRQSGEASDLIKLQTLGLLTMNYFGEGVLNAAIASLDRELRRTAVATSRTTRAAQTAQQAATTAMHRAKTAMDVIRGAADIPRPVEQAVSEQVAEAARVVEATQTTAERAAEAEAVATSLAAVTASTTATPSNQNAPAPLEGPAETQGNGDHEGQERR